MPLLPQKKPQRPYLPAGRYGLCGFFQNAGFFCSDRTFFNAILELKSRPFFTGGMNKFFAKRIKNLFYLFF